MTNEEQKNLRLKQQKEIDIEIKKITKVYKEAQKNLLEKIKDYAARQYLNSDNIYEYNRIGKLKAKIEEEVKILNQKTKELITKQQKLFYIDSHNLSTYIMTDEIGVNVAKKIFNDKAVIEALRNPLEFVSWEDRLKTNLARTIIKINSEIATGITIGEGYSKIAKRLTDVFKVSENEAFRIAWTESHRAQEKANIDSIDYAQSLGLEFNRVWLSAVDNRTRETHRRADGQYADDNGNFTLDGNIKTRAPGLSGVAKEDINCRCTVIIKYVGDELKERRVRNLGIVKYKTYDEYLESA